MCAVIIILLVVTFWSFHNYKVEVSDTRENTLVYSYYSAGGNILKCASDTASLSDSKNETLWTITYEMQDPQVSICGDSFAIYDKNGTSVCLCNQDGKIGSFNTELPIIKADVAKQGTVAVLMDDGSTAQIDYFDKDSSMISTIKTTLANDGYPMDIALSEDGLLLGVSYINYNLGAPVSDVKFYSFGAAGQIVTDNIVSSFHYENTIIPELEFMGSKNCAAFGTNRIIVYEGSKAPAERTVIDINDEIRSTVSDSDCFGIVMTGNDNKGYEIVLYNKNGSEKTRINTDFSYTSVEVTDGLILMYNRNEMCIYSTSGIFKYRGKLDFLIRQIRFIEANRYALAATDSYNIIRLY